MRLTELAPGKVNLCLLLGGLRQDGRHEVVTLIESVSLVDRLTVSDSDHDEVRCPGVEEPNLVARALRGLRARGWRGPPVRVEIEKQIPLAGGMGGGSADAAAMLRLARRIAPIAERALAELAAELGADVPSQLSPGLVLGRGAGERIVRRPPLPEHAFVIVPLPHRLAAADVYAEADRLGLGRPPGELAALGACDRLPFVNDLQPAAISLCPAIVDALAAVQDAGVDHALVSGSGPTVVGVLWGPAARRRAQAAARALPGAKSAVPVQAVPRRRRDPAQSHPNR